MQSYAVLYNELYLFRNYKMLIPQHYLEILG